MTLPTISTAPTAPSRTSDTPADFVTHADAFVTWLSGLSAELNTYSAALVAVVSGTDFNGTSVSSVAIGTGSKSWTTQSGKLWQVGQFVIVADSATPANYCYGQVTAYSSTTLTVNVTATGGSGTKTAWAIGLAPNASAYLGIGGGTLTGLLTTLASATGGAGFNLPHGTAPTSPVNGDAWTTTAGLWARINGASYLAGLPVSNNAILGRTTAGTGSAEQITVGAGLNFGSTQIDVEGSFAHALNGGI